MVIPSANYNLLARAQQLGRPAQFYYHGLPRTCRIFELRWEGDQSSLLAWQYGGLSTTGPIPCWRHFQVSEMGPVSLGPEDGDHPLWNPTVLRS